MWFQLAYSTAKWQTRFSTNYNRPLKVHQQHSYDTLVWNTLHNKGTCWCWLLLWNGSRQQKPGWAAAGRKFTCWLKSPTFRSMFVRQLLMSHLAVVKELLVAVIKVTFNNCFSLYLHKKLRCDSDFSKQVKKI